MRYVIDSNVVKKNELDLPQLFALLLVKTCSNIDDVLKVLTEKEALVVRGGNYMITQRWNDLCDNILLTSDSAVPQEDIITPLAEKLIAIFPKGKKPGTPYYWKCNRREVALKLKSFFKLYGNKYTEEEILDAAKRYVESFNGDYRFMRLLKYFIWKKGDEGTEISELATFIDNANQQDAEENNWINELR